MKLKYLLGGLLLVITTVIYTSAFPSFAGYSSNFLDVSGVHPNVKAIKHLQSEKILVGYNDGNFKPDQSVTRAEFVKIALLNSGYKPEGKNCFSDVKEEWFATYVCAATKAGIISGYSDGTFRPNQTVTFAEASKIVSKTLNLGVDTSAFPNSDPQWYKPYILTLEDKKAIPYDIGSLNHEISRAIASEIIWRITEKRRYKPSNNLENILKGVVAEGPHSNLAKFNSCQDMHDYFEDNTSKTDYSTFEKSGYFDNVPTNAIAIAPSMAEKGGCFTGETKILMADGSYKYISEIKESDIISTRKSTESSEPVNAKVSGTIKHLVPGYLVLNESLEVTPEHLLFVNGGWKTAGEVEKGDYLINPDGTKVEVNSIEKVEKPTWVYNFEVEDYHTYIANGIYVHNEKEETADYSSTNLQDQNVDEADFIKNDGKYIYILDGDTVRIVEAYPANDMKELDQIDFADKNFYPEEMYLDGNNLIVIGNTSTSGYFEDFETKSVNPDFYYNGGNTKIYVLDVSNKSKITIAREVALEGDYNSSRKVSDTVYVVLNQYNYSYPWRDDWKEDDLVPLYIENGKLDKLVNCNDVSYMPQSIDESDFLIVAAVPLNPKESISSEVVMGNSEEIYASPDNLYVTKPKYNWSGYYEETGETAETFVHRFALNDGNIAYKGMGIVPGTILNQFSMDEYKDNFRIATTSGNVWDTKNPSTNNLYVLDSKMGIIGKIEGMAKGESIYAVRFVGDRAYVVTFKKIDPLFVIGLEDPKNPTVLGYLKIPGFSDYLHPYDKNHIIGFGLDTAVPTEEEIEARGIDFAWYQGIKMAMFDVSDVKNPKELHKEIIGDRGTTSPLNYDHKALLYSTTKGLNGGNLMAFPIAVAEIPEEVKNDPYTSANTYGDFVFQGGYVYDVSPAIGFKLRGKITHYDDSEVIDEQGWYYYGDDDIKRIIYIGDYFYTISNSAILASRMNSPLEPVKRVEFSK